MGMKNLLGGGGGCRQLVYTQGSSQHAVLLHTAWSTHLQPAPWQEHAQPAKNPMVDVWGLLHRA